MPTPAAPHDAPHAAQEQATFAGGCFWCIEAAFNQLQGVVHAESGYANGHHPHPDYEAVCTGQSGHAEVVRVTFDPNQIAYSDLLAVFFCLHDPTTLNRQGHDVGTQYRSGIYTHNDNQAEQARACINQLTQEGVFERPIVTEVQPVANYHPAEAEHQGYAQRHPGQPYCAYVVAPKLAKFRQAFQARLKPAT